MGKAGRGRGRGWFGAAVLVRRVAADMGRTPGTEEGTLLARRPVCLEGERKGVLLLLPAGPSLDQSG